MSHSDLTAFIRAYRPDKLFAVTDERRAIMTEGAPTLTVIDKAYGDGSAAVWTMQVLSVFNEYVGKREKMDDWQIENLAKSIVSGYGWLKASEIMLFLARYASGHYGSLYGVIDPTEITVNLKEKFIPWRAMIVREVEDEKASAERESYASRPGILKPDQIKALKERISRINDSLNNS